LLGVAFLLTASAFSDPQIHWLETRFLAFAQFPASLAAHIHFTSFIAAYTWMFVQDFPDRPKAPHLARLLRWTTRFCFIWGSLLFIANVLIGILNTTVVAGSPLSVVLSYFDERGVANLYWPSIIILSLPALPISIIKSRTAAIHDRYRMDIFTTGLLVGLLPILLDILLSTLVPPYERFISVWPANVISKFVVYGLLLTVPFTTAYAVLVYNALDIRFVPRKVVRYTLARNTLLAVALAPVLVFALYLYDRRESRLVDILIGWRPLLHLLLVAGGLALFGIRKRLLKDLDVRFARQDYDASELLARISSIVQEDVDARTLINKVVGEIEVVLQLERCGGMLINNDETRLEGTRDWLPSLDLSSTMTTRALTRNEPFVVSETTFQLRDDHLAWLAATRPAVIVPLLSPGGVLQGLVSIGARKSELPFKRRDLLMLSSVSSSLSLRLHKIIKVSHASELARQCTKCDVVFESTATRCSVCGDVLSVARTPHIVSGKFRVQRKIGAGGMGIVYKATDLALGRTVAIKALPAVTPDLALRLRHEARAMASVTHPNVAIVFSIENWRDAPLIVCEYLEGGTLSDRLRQGPFPLNEVLDLGIALTSALESFHSKGMIHRDIKPSNIGFTADGSSKLLDLGLAKVLGDCPDIQMIASPESRQPAAATLTWIAQPNSNNLIIGTPAYLSPEALSGGAVQPAFDLWSLAISLYEALSGRNPMAKSTVAETLACVRTGCVPDIRDFVTVSSEVADFFKRCTAQDRTLRPRTAGQFKSSLEQLKTASAPTSVSESSR
jgi:hypothetical protein